MQILNEPKQDNVRVPVWRKPVDYVSKKIWWKESPYCIIDWSIVKFKNEKTGKVKPEYKTEYEMAKRRKQRWVNK